MSQIGAITDGWRLVLEVTNRPVEILAQPQTQTVDPGGAVQFRVVASGTPPLFYQWRLNGAILPDETNSTLMLDRVQPRDGGSYSVFVYTESEAFASPIAELRVPAPTVPAATDDFRSRPLLQDTKGELQGDSRRATSETTEPVPPGGGKSVWYEWVAPADGIVEWSTRGSAFDTLLTVFTGTELRNLTRVVGDDDTGGFYTSALRFTARRGMSYQIAMDGFGVAGAGGSFTLRWAFQATTATVPLILIAPVAQSVPPGRLVIFSVAADSPVTYQWFFQGAPIAGAESSSYTIAGARADDVGFYQVRLRNRDGQETASVPVDLQLSSVEGALVLDKYQKLGFFGVGGVLAASVESNPGVAGFISIGFGGVVLTNQFYSKADSQQGDPTPCGSPFFGTLWLGLTATNTGIIQVDTIGSQIPARLAVYQLTGGVDDFSEPPLICDLTSGPGGQPCLVQFNARLGTNYTVVVEGYKTNGLLKLTSRMGVAPPPPAVAQCLFAAVGTSLQFQMPATNWFPAPRCQWQLDGQALAGETNATLVLASLTASWVGAYSVVMSNFVSATTNLIAEVALAGPFPLSQGLVRSHGKTAFVVSGKSEKAVVLQFSANPGGPWFPLLTNKDPCVTLVYTNSNLLLDPHRFYRAVEWLEQ